MELSKEILAALASFLVQQSVQKHSGVLGRLSSGEWPYAPHDDLSGAKIGTGSGREIPLSELRRISDEEIQQLTAEIADNVFTALSFIVDHPEILTSDQCARFREITTLPLNQEPVVNEIMKGLLEFLLSTTAASSLTNYIRDALNEPCPICRKKLKIVNSVLLCSKCNGYHIELPESVCAELGPEICQVNPDHQKSASIERRKEVLSLSQQEGLSLADIGKRFDLSRERARQIYVKALMELESIKRQNDALAALLFKKKKTASETSTTTLSLLQPAADEDILDKKVEELGGLSCRVRNCLKRAKIVTVRDLVAKSEYELSQTNNLGRKSMSEIKAALRKFKLHLRANAKGRVLNIAYMSIGDDS